MSKRRWVQLACLIYLSVVTTGCAHRAHAPISQKSAVKRETTTIHRAGDAQRTAGAKPPTHYVIRKGDTLYAVAWRFGIDYRSLITWNQIKNPDLIHPGQKLRLTAPAAGAVKRATSKKAKPAKRPATARNANARQSKSRATRDVQWRWPAQGKARIASSALGSKGIEILGKRGSPVKSASAGRVVYSGDGLRGYGNLIIIKHNEEFLSAYAHNDRILVKEGQQVRSGEQIAKMGDTEAKRVMLHFEIRRNGKAIPPLSYLPQR